MRGNDVESTPVILSYLLLGEKKLTWYVQEKCLSEKIKILLDMQGIKAAPYAQIYEDVKKLPEEASIYYDKSAVNTALVSSLPEKVKKIEGVNPTFLFKAKKNPVEVENERNAHIKDGVTIYDNPATVASTVVSPLPFGKSEFLCLFCLGRSRCFLRSCLFCLKRANCNGCH